MVAKNIVLAFDAYGTLLSTESIAKKLATHFSEDAANTIAATWRKYQLEYTWRANSMGLYFDFSVVTRRALRHALAESGVSLDENQTKDIMKEYDSLSTFPDVKPTLQKLQEIKDLTVVIHTNGTYDMVSNCINNSPDLSPFAGLFQDIVGIDYCRKYKPAAEAYQLLAKKVGKDILKGEEMGEIWHVSANPFDVAGAKAVGFNSIWVDRKGTGWQDSLIVSERGRPSETVTSLDQVVEIMKRVTGSERSVRWKTGGS